VHPVIVTISRQDGAQGEAVGRAIAETLGWRYFDREIIAQAAAMAHVSEAAIEQAQRVPSLLTRMMEALGRYPAGFELAEAISGVPPSPPLSSDSYRAFVEQVIRELAETSDAVLIGHAAQAVLRDVRGALHVLICAPLAQRARLIGAEEGIGPEDAARRARERDGERSDFYQRYYQIRWRNPANYDLVLNTGRLPIGAAAQTVVDLVNVIREE
jgi:hypothetical protein